jgi:hypothetical protein
MRAQFNGSFPSCYSFGPQLKTDLIDPSPEERNRKALTIARRYCLLFMA